ncbi:hypothetical protein BYT27DRAFT_7181703 [Phlegmacium glaucopus]|nr:hypothetical protein BYT27DRAFT_7181703 [Phlegmacium glaucopus]
MERTVPVAIPASYLVLYKLKEWDECQTRNPSDKSTHLACKDLMTLLRNLRTSKPKFRHDPAYDCDLHNESAARVDRFIAAHNSFGREWRQMGFGEGPRVTSTSTSKGPRVTSTSTSKGPRVSNTSTSTVPKAPVRPRRTNLGYMRVRSLAAQTTVAILSELGLPCAIFGSMACKLYGNQRFPNDVDILVLPPPERASMTQEEIKALIVRHAPPDYHFVLKPSRNPEATYKVLYFVAKPRPSTSTSFDSITHDFASMALRDTTNATDDDTTSEEEESSSHPIRIPRAISSKVDILLPGVMNLPALPTSMLTQRSSLPLVPFPVLLLQKLQAWTDHCAATEARYRRKISVDVRDLEWCLNSGAVHGHLMRYVLSKDRKSRKELWKEVWSDRRMFSEEFEELSRMRVEEFCERHEGLRAAWRAIGFDV